MAEEHDGDERRELPPEILSLSAEGYGEAETKRHDDGQRDQSHHAGQPIPYLPHGTLQKDHSAVEEQDGSEDGRDVARSRKSRRLEMEPLLDHRRPNDGWHRQRG